MLKNILNIKFDIIRARHSHETSKSHENNEKPKNTSDYFTNPELRKSEKNKEQAKKADKESEIQLKDVIKKF
jgi:hypothetical protein